MEHDSARLSKCPARRRLPATRGSQHRASSFPCLKGKKQHCDIFKAFRLGITIMLIQEVLQLRTRIASIGDCFTQCSHKWWAWQLLPAGVWRQGSGRCEATWQPGLAPYWPQLGFEYSLTQRQAHSHTWDARDEQLCSGNDLCLHRTPPPHVYAHTRAVEHFFVYVRVIAVVGLPTVEGDWRVSPEQSGAEQRAQSLHERTRRRRCAPLLALLHYFLSDHQDDV